MIKVKVFEGDIDDCVAIIEHYATQRGYENHDFSWTGPLYKPETSYLTQDGYPLGTTIWYVKVEIGGRYIRLFGESFRDAATAAHHYIKNHATK